MPADTPADVRELVEKYVLVTAADREDIEHITERFTTITRVSPPALLSIQESRKSKKTKKKSEREFGHSGRSSGKSSSKRSTKSDEKTK